MWCEGMEWYTEMMQRDYARRLQEHYDAAMANDLALGLCVAHAPDLMLWCQREHGHAGNCVGGDWEWANPIGQMESAA